MELVLITIVLLALAFAGIAIKIWGKKDGKFSRYLCQPKSFSK